MKTLLKLSFVLLTLVPAEGYPRNKLAMSQYMHNQFAINSAFAGSRETMTLFAGYRQQWVGIPGSPHSQFLSAHAPLKNENVALGFSLFSESFAVARNTGFSAAYAYRVRITGNSRLAFSLSAGFASAGTGLGNLTLLDPGDETFGQNETWVVPRAGFGIAWYGNQFFAGLSIPDLLYSEPFHRTPPAFEPSKTGFILTGGYLFTINHAISIQPSTLLRHVPAHATVADMSANVIIHQAIWTGFTYRTNREVVAHLGWQATEQLRVTYSYDYPTGRLGALNNGSHEISLQFDLKYKIETVSPRFF